ncbi:hypothetical protein BCU00_019560 [Vibrio breoganii]|uniref:hypothetical protein n=1 Tax=Vibrio breoganii TaxID=553239 RepID=UPI0039A60626
MRYAFEEAGGSITKEQVETELTKRSDTLSAEYSDGTRWTTQAALKTEKRILQNIADGKDQHQPFATPKQVQDFLDTKPRLTQGQKGRHHPYLNHQRQLCGHPRVSRYR